MRTLSALLAIGAASCQTSYLVARGDVALERGDPEQALADYLEALARPISADSKQKIEQRRNEAAFAFAKKEIEPGVGEDRGALRGRLWSLASTNLLGSAQAKETVLDAIARLDSDEWKKVDGDISIGHFVPARVRARLLAAPFDEPSAPRSREREIAERARAHHLVLAAKGDEASAYLHAMVASSLGAVVDDLERRKRKIDALAVVHWEVEIDETTCPTVALELSRRRSPEPRSFTARVRVDRCREEEKSWIETEVQTYRARVPTPEIVEEPYWIEDQRGECRDLACRRHDELGVCLERVEPPEGCDPAGARRIEIRHVPTIVYRDVEQSMEVAIHRRRIGIEGSGVIEIAGVETPFTFERSSDDRAFWHPDRSQPFSSPNLGGAVGSIGMEIEQKVRSAFALEISRDLGERGSGLSEEARHVVAVHVSRRVPPEAARFFFDRYGMSEAQILSVLGFGRPIVESPAAPAARALVPPERDPELDAFELEAVAADEPVEGLGQLTRPGIDLSAMFAMSALDTAGISTGLSARFRLTRLHLGMSGASTLLGGDVGGFGVSMLGVAFDAEKEGLLFSFGLSYEQQRSEVGELYRSFSLPIVLRVGIASFLWAGIRFDPNLLFAKTIFDDEVTDPHFWSPLSVWLTADLEYVFGRVAVFHYLGAGLDEPVQVEVSLGVRL